MFNKQILIFKMVSKRKKEHLNTYKWGQRILLIFLLKITLSESKLIQTLSKVDEIHTNFGQNYYNFIR